MVQRTSLDTIGQLTDQQVGGVLQEGLRAALRDPRALRAAGEVLPDALDGNVRALVKRLRATADRGDTAYGRIWDEIERALVARGLVAAPESAAEPGGGVGGKREATQPRVPSGPRPLKTENGEISLGELIDACQTYGAVNRRLTTEQVMRVLIDGQVAAINNVAGYLGDQPESLRDYAISGAWRGNAWRGGTIENERGVGVPGEMLVREHLAGAQTNALAARYQLEPDALAEWFEKRGWLEPEGRLPKRFAVPPEDKGAAIPPALTQSLDGKKLKLPADEVVRLYAVGARISIAEARAELYARQPRAEIVQALAVYIGTDSGSVDRYLQQGRWGRLVFGGALESDGKRVDARDVLERYVQNAKDPNLLGTLAMLADRDPRAVPAYGQQREIALSGSAVRKTAADLGINANDLAAYLTGGAWIPPFVRRAEPIAPGDVFEPLEMRVWQKADEQPEASSLSTLELVRGPIRLRHYIDARTQLLMSDELTPKLLEQFAATPTDAAPQRYNYNQPKAPAKIELDPEFPRLKTPVPNEVDETELMRCWLEGGAPATRAVFESEATIAKRAERLDSKADPEFRWALFNAHRAWVKTHVPGAGWGEQMNQAEADAYRDSPVVVLPHPPALAKAIETLNAKRIDELGTSIDPNIQTAADAPRRSPLELLADLAREKVAPSVQQAARPVAKAGPPPGSALDKLNKLEGLASVKQSLKEVVSLVKQSKERQRRGLQPVPMSLHARFEGNPGTGKTTVARLYGEALKEAGFLQKGHVVEVGGAELLTGGVQAIEAKIKEALGGVLIIDELYQLNPKTNPQGRDIANYLLKAMEDHRDELVVIGTGYQKEMEELIAFNDGFNRRFSQRFEFEDYDDPALCRILQKIAADHGYEMDQGLVDRAVRRVARGRGPGFGNAGAVRNLFEASIRRQGLRLDDAEARGVELEDADYKKLITDDVLGPEADRAFGPLPALDKLDAMIGLEEVKNQVHALVDMLRLNQQREAIGQDSALPPLHAVFSGNPGTGKTTVAKLYGQVLKELGYLSNGEVLVVKREDLVGTVVGETEQKVKKLLERARGKVLVIDEAYSLYSKAENDFGRIAIDTLVANVQATAGEDLCLIMTGYGPQMDEMLRKANPGLSRRMAQRFEFADYNDSALDKILQKKATERAFSLTAEGKKAAVAYLARERAKPNFGNGGAVDNLLNKAIERQSSRLAKLAGPAGDALLTLTLEDLVGDLPKPEEAGAGLARLVGLKEVKEKVAEYQALIEQAKLRGDDPLDYFEPAFVFTGDLGTGKATVAKEMGKVFSELGFLAGDEVVQVSAGDLIAGYQGQTSGKTLDVLESALGKTLYIDGAQGLADLRNPYAAEAIDRITKFLAAHKGQLALILAGTGEEMQNLLDRSAELRRQFTERLDFAPYTPAECAEILRQRLAEKKFVLAPDADRALTELMRELAGAPSFGNADDVVSLVAKVVRKQAVRVTREKSRDRTTVLTADLRAALDELLANKQREGARATRVAVEPIEPAIGDGAVASASPTPVLRTRTAIDAATRSEEIEAALPPKTAPWVEKLLRTLEQSFATAKISAKDSAKALATGSLPPAVETAVAKALGLSVEELRELLVSEKAAILAKLEGAKKTQKTEWVCGFCGNSNPGCPYRKNKIGGSYRPVDG